MIGGASMIIIQQFQNIAMTLGVLPITGITLPFISYGGTSSLFLLAEIGIVLNVSKKCK